MIEKSSLPQEDIVMDYAFYEVGILDDL